MYITYILHRDISGQSRERFHFCLMGSIVKLTGHCLQERETTRQSWQTTVMWSSIRHIEGLDLYLQAHQIPPLSNAEQEQVKAGILSQITFTWPGE